MKNILLFVGKEFLINTAICEYVKREASKKIGPITSIKYLFEKDKDLFVHISEAIEIYERVLLITLESTYATVSKVVATIFEDNLKAVDNMLIPSKAREIEHNSFLIEQEGKEVNVIEVTLFNKVPSILLNREQESGFGYIFDLQREIIEEKLLALAKSYEVDYILAQETIELYKFYAYDKKFGDLAMFMQNAKLLLPDHLIVANNIFTYLIERLSVVEKKITFAESCTGGLLASMLTKVPGSSKIFNGSLITYANEIKNTWLGVKKETLQKYGAVSEETVEEMLDGALRVSQADYAVAISGIAGPGGATKTKPVGMVVIGCKSKEDEIVRTLYLQGDRNYIQYQAAMYGVKLIFEIAKDELF